MLPRMTKLHPWLIKNGFTVEMLDNGVETVREGYKYNPYGTNEGAHKYKTTVYWIDNGDVAGRLYVDHRAGEFYAFEESRYSTQEQMIQHLGGGCEISVDVTVGGSVQSRLIKNP